MKEPVDYNHYIPDPDIAPIVRRIFMMSRNGMLSTNIAKILTDEKTIVPSEIVGNTHTRKDQISRGWNRNTVNRIEMKEITRTMLVSLVDRIEMSENKEITIYYKFNILNMTEIQDENSLTNAG